MRIASLLNQPKVSLLAGIPSLNMNLFHKCQFAVGDPAVWLEWPQLDGHVESLFLLRDIEMERARVESQASHVACPATFEPIGGLSGDRETATAQALAHCLKAHHVLAVRTDRSLPFVYANILQESGVRLEYDPNMGVMDRRFKSEIELKYLAQAQTVTETVMLKACQTICRAEADPDGKLYHEGSLLTSERLRCMIDDWLLKEGFANPGSIVACGKQGADCHAAGTGPLWTGQPVIVDIFPVNKQTRYHGDCTRTAVHGTVPAEVQRAYQAVVKAKQAAIGVTREGISGQAVHEATLAALRENGFEYGLDRQQQHPDRWFMVHGTGHGIGLEVHEPPLLDIKGPALGSHEVLTIEPGLYSLQTGGVRSEDMVVVQAHGARNLNGLPDTLSW